MFAEFLAGLSLALKQPLAGYCDVETSHHDALLTNKGDYVSAIRVLGMKHMASDADIAELALSLRINLSGALENKGHAIVGAYISDPEMSLREIDQINMRACREVAKQLSINLDSIFDERMRLWPGLMRWEGSYLFLWTRRGVLNKEEMKHLKAETAALAKQCPQIGESQKFFLRSEIMAAHHSGFVSRVCSALAAIRVNVEDIPAREALVISREFMYRETAFSGWRPVMFGDKVMPRLPEEHVKRPGKEGLLWPSFRSQLFADDAVLHGGQQVDLGDYSYASVDLAIGPERALPLSVLVSNLGNNRIPWRATFILEGGGQAGMAFKEIGANFLSMFPANRDLQRGFAEVQRARREDNHIGVKLRASFATWAPKGEQSLLRRRVARLAQTVEAWGNCKTARVTGDPLDGVMSSVPGLSLSSTGVPALALLGEAVPMLPWNHIASPWKKGSILFRTPNGAIWPYDPSGGSKRPVVIDIFVAPPGSGKSVLANTINIGLCLSPAVLGSDGAELPLIGKIDIGSSAQGFVLLMREALGPKRAHEAIYVTMQLAPGFEFNIFDLQLGCEKPLPLERAFLENFLALLTLPPDQKTPFEGIPQLISLVIDEAYFLCTEAPRASPKRYRKDVEPLVDLAIERYGIELHAYEPYWRDVVTALVEHGEYRLAEIAQRYAVPVLQDLVAAARSDQVKDMFRSLKISATAEEAPELFQRYIYDAIRRYPTLNSPTKLDFGPARIIVIDLQEVAPTGSASANRQTEMMYMLARHIIARNFYLKPDYLHYVPEAMQRFHGPRFQKIYETVKRLDFDECHRMAGSPLALEQCVRDAREGRKHNVQLGFASQKLSDFGDELLTQSTGIFVLKTGDSKEAEQIINRFGLVPSSAEIIRHGLTGPGPGGAPFLAVLSVDNASYQLKLVNSLGPVELWALSTTPADAALRNRLYRKLGSAEALRRLALIFPNGSALTEIERRKDDRMKLGETLANAEHGVTDELSHELIDGYGIALKLRAADSEENDILIAAQ